MMYILKNLDNQTIIIDNPTFHFLTDNGRERSFFYIPGRSSAMELPADLLSQRRLLVAIQYAAETEVYQLDFTHPAYVTANDGDVISKTFDHGKREEAATILEQAAAQGFTVNIPK